MSRTSRSMPGAARPFAPMPVPAGTARAGKDARSAPRFAVPDNLLEA